jgi:hypothetical protein
MENNSILNRTAVGFLALREEYAFHHKGEEEDEEDCRRLTPGSSTGEY